MARKAENVEVAPQKRGHGESTVVQRPDGTWMGQVSFGNTPDGKRSRKTAYGKTRAEVVRKIKELEALRTAGQALPTKDVTVEALMKRWLDEVVEPSLKPSTFRSYEQMVRNHIVPALGKRKLSQIDVSEIDRFLQSKQAKGTDGVSLAPQTVRYIRGLFRRAWRFAMKWGWVSAGTNLVTLSEPVAVRRNKTVVLSGDDIHQLVEAFSGCRDEVLFTTALGLGLRLGEVLGIRWQDLVFDETGGGTVSIRFQLQRIKGKLQLVLPKSESSQRTIHLPRSVAEALKKRRDIQEQERLLSGSNWNNSFDLVFTNRDGGPLDSSRVRKRFKEVIAASAQDNLRLHDLRHIAASHLLGAGISVADTAANLGHADPYLVVRTYGHAMPQGKREAAEAMEKAFAQRKIDVAEE